MIQRSNKKFSVSNCLLSHTGGIDCYIRRKACWRITV